MKLDDIVKQLANRINQPHYVESILKKVILASYDEGFRHGKELNPDFPNDVDKLKNNEAKNNN